MESTTEGAPLDTCLISSVGEMARAGLSESLDQNLAPERNEKPLLHKCISAGYVERLQTSLQQGVDMNQIDNDGSTPLMTAVQLGNMQCVEILLQAGASVSLASKQGQTALSLACKSKDDSFLKFFVDAVNGSGVDYGKEVEKCLCREALSGNVSIVQCLLDSGLCSERILGRCLGEVIDHSSAAPKSSQKHPTDDFMEGDDRQRGTPTAGAGIQIAGILIKAGAKVTKEMFCQACKKGDFELCQMLISHCPGLNYLSRHGTTPLTEAVSQGHSSIVKLLLDSGAQPDKANCDGYTPFLLSCRHVPDSTILRLLFSAGCDVNRTFSESMKTPLMTATERNQISLVQTLLDFMPDLERVDQLHNTALCQAIKGGHSEIARVLMDRGASVNHADKYYNTPLFMAVERNNVDMIRLLVQNGSAVNHTNKDVNTALFVAVKKNYTDAIRVLIELGASTDSADRDMCTLPMLAARGDLREVLFLLIQAGAQLDCQDKEGRTALMMACQAGNVECFKLLLDSGADIALKTRKGLTVLGHSLTNVDTNEKVFGKVIESLELFLNEARSKSVSLGEEIYLSVGYTSFNILTWAAKHNKVNLVRTLCEMDFDLKRTSGNVDAALCLAAEANNSEVVQVLLDHGADVDLPNRYENSPLSLAAKANSVNSVRVLLSHGARVDQTNSFRNTPLCVAADKNNAEIVRLLLEHGAKIDHVNKDDNTALSLATISGHVKVAQTLIERGAAINVTNVNSFTPVMLAAQRRPCDILTSLIEAGAELDNQDKEGRTALMLACVSGNLHGFEILLDAGADIAPRDKTGHSVLSFTLHDSNSHLSARAKKKILDFLVYRGDPIGQDFHILILSNLDSTGVPIARVIRNKKVLPSLEYFRSGVLPREFAFLASQGLTPFSCALLANNHDLARFFAANWFLHSRDLQCHLSQDFANLQIYSEGSNQFLQNMLSQPLTLKSLSFVQVSTCLGFGSSRDDRITRCGLPPFLQRWLRFETTEWQSKPSEWANLTFESLHMNRADIQHKKWGHF